MNLKDFKKRIQETPLYTEEQQAHFLSRAKSYTPTIRKSLIDILDLHEKQLLAQGQNILMKVQKERSELVHANMRKAEIIHEREITQAEKMLETDLEILKKDDVEVKPIEPPISTISKSKISGSTIYWATLLVIFIISGLLVWKFDILGTIESKYIDSQNVEIFETEGLPLPETIKFEIKKQN